MPRDVAFVQLEADEDATSVRDRLSFLRGQNVLLIWPEDGTALTRKLDLVLIQREAMRRAIRLAFVTHDPQVVLHAQDLDISTFETIGASERGRWKRGRGKVFTNRFQKPKDEPNPEDLMPVASRVRGPRRLPLPNAARLALVVLVLAVLLGAAYVVVPGATVTLTIAKLPLQADVLVTAYAGAAGIDAAGAIIPARIQLVQVTQTGTRQTTGALDQPPTLAGGTVTFVNRTDQPIPIPSGTVVSTADGTPVRFQTLTEATLGAGAGQSVEVSIQAQAEYAGEQGNVGALKIVVVEAEWADDVTVSNLLPLSGGQTRALPVVTQQDRDRLRAAVRQQVQAQAQAELQTLLGAGEFVIDESIAITPDSERADWQVYSAEVGAIASEVTLEMRAVVQALIVSQRDAEQLGFAALSRQIPRGRTLDIGTLSYQRGPIETVAPDSVTFRVFAEGQVTGQIDTAALRDILAGRSLEDARLYLTSVYQLAEGTAPDIALSASFDGNLPRLPARISILIVEVDP
jgi:hypothetical protein